MTDLQKVVLKGLYEFGPMTDIALSVWVHHFAEEQYSSSGIRSRRVELSRMTPPLVKAVGTKHTRTRRATVHDLTPAGRKLAKSLFGAKVGVHG